MPAFWDMPSELRRKISARSSFRVRRFCEQKILSPDFLRTRFCERILLVGDRPGPGRPTSENFHHTPFYAGSHSSLFLHLQLEEGGINEEDLHWVNAFDHHDQPSSPDILQFDWRLVVALGENARGWVDKNYQRRFAAVKHPQYWRRFKSKEPYPLIRLLKNPDQVDHEGVAWYNLSIN